MTTGNPRYFFLLEPFCSLHGRFTHPDNLLLLLHIVLKHNGMGLLKYVVSIFVRLMGHPLLVDDSDNTRRALSYLRRSIQDEREKHADGCFNAVTHYIYTRLNG